MQPEGSAVAEECWRAAVGVSVACFSPHLVPIPYAGVCGRGSSCRPLNSAAPARQAPLPTPPPPPPTCTAPAVAYLLQIPVQLRLADSELSSLEHPPVLYVSAQPLRCTRCHCSPTDRPLLTLLTLHLIPASPSRPCLPACSSWCPARATCTAWCRRRCTCCSTCCHLGSTRPGLSTDTCPSSGEGPTTLAAFPCCILNRPLMARQTRHPAPARCCPCPWWHLLSFYLQGCASWRAV